MKASWRRWHLVQALKMERISVSRKGGEGHSRRKAKARWRQDRNSSIWILLKEIDRASLFYGPLLFGGLKTAKLPLWGSVWCLSPSLPRALTL
jgi:hypothetical protein